MNETTKTGIYWVAALIALAIGVFVSLPPSSDSDLTTVVGTPLIEGFNDPSAAASMKLVTFDDEQGSLDSFEVRKDAETGQWTIPSRSGYPADAVDQMKEAATSLVGLQILDVIQAESADHESFGVVEPKFEDLEAGDEGVGRMVTFKDGSQKTLAAVILGNKVRDSEDQVYVRLPGQDPVYVVKLDDTVLSTKFQDWIEDDLLQLSSIDVEKLGIRDYSASMVAGGGVRLSRNYDATLAVEGSDWTLENLVKYDPGNPSDPGTAEDLSDAKSINDTKLNEIKNALDDLKIVDVVRKPEGMSENLRLTAELASDNEAISSLVSRGFLPVGTADGGVEILSGNGELTATLDDGVQYVLRFGSVEGLGESADDAAQDNDEDASEPGGTGLNRYLLVTTRIDESQFPPPDLKPIPQSIDELKAMMAGPEDQAQPEQPAATPPADPAPSETSDGNQTKPDGEMTTEPKPEVAKPEVAKPEVAKPEVAKPEVAKPEDSKPEAPKPEDPKPQDPKPQDPKPDKPKPDDASPEPADPQPAPTNKPTDGPAEVTEVTEEPSGQVDTQGQGEGAAEGQGIDDDSPSPDQTEDPTETPATEPTPEAEQPAVADAGPEAETAEPAKTPLQEFEALPANEQEERLEAEQEKITKENTRQIDARKDKLAAAGRRVTSLNDRFADWYYVIPESTYNKLKVSEDELFAAESDDEPATPDFGAGLPDFGN